MARVRAAYASLPLVFEPNLGQTDPSVLYLSRNKGFILFLTPSEAVLKFRSPLRHPRMAAGLNPLQARRALRRAGGHALSKILRLRWLGCTARPDAETSQPLAGHSNYFYGRNPGAWVTDVPQYAMVTLKDLYPGIALRYRDGGKDTLEFDWLIRPGADPGRIALKVDGVRSLSLDALGNARADLGDGQVFTLAAPRAHQDGAMGRRAVSAAFLLLGPRTLGLALGHYDHGLPLVVDPALQYSTYLGGFDFEMGQGIAADAAGDAFVAGVTESTDFPTTSGALQSSLGVSPNSQTPRYGDAFVSKISPDGSTLIYSTYLGGGQSSPTADGTVANAIALDAAGDAYIVGGTDNSDFPLVNAEQSAYSAPYTCAFVSKLNPTGDALLYSTYLGTSQYGEAFGVAVDSQGSATVVGATEQGFPTLNALQAVCQGCFNSLQDIGTNAFVAKFNPSGGSLAYSTYLGLTASTAAYAVALDPSGDATVVGMGSVPLAGPLYSAGTGFVSELKADGSALIYSTQIPGITALTPQGSNYGYGPYNGLVGVAVDATGSAYITGQAGPGLPLKGPLQTQTSGPFVMKLNPRGVSLAYSTYLGGGPQQSGYGEVGSGAGIAVDSSGNAYVAGWTYSSTLPLVNPLQTTCPACTVNLVGTCDIFLDVLNPTGSALIFATYFGGSGYSWSGGPTGGTVGDEVLAIALDPSDDIYLTGYTPSTDFPVFHALQPTLSNSQGDQKAFVVKISGVVTPPASTATPSPTVSPTATLSPTFTATFTASPSATATPSFTHSPTASRTPTVSPTFTVTPTLTPTEVPLLLTPHYPNPDPAGAGGVWLPYTISTAAWVDMKVYDVSGELVRAWSDDPRWESVGTHQREWDENNSWGRSAASGVYLVLIHARDAAGDQEHAWEKCALAR